MSNRSLAARVQEDLAQAVASGLLPASVQERAEKLLERLKTPVRVSLLGLPGSGKSTVLNLLLGAIAVPVNVPFPTLQLTYGDPAQSICTLPNGTKETVPHANGKTIADLSPAFVEMQMPLPALGKISLLEVVTPDDPLALDLGLVDGLQRSHGCDRQRCRLARRHRFGRASETVDVSDRVLGEAALGDAEH